MRRTFEPAERRGDGRSLRVRVLVAVSLLVASLLASALTAPVAGASGVAAPPAGAAPVVGCVPGSHVAGKAYHYGLNDPLRYADPSGASAEVGRGGVSDAALVAGSWPDGIVDGLASLPGLLGDNLSSLLDTGAALLGDCRLLPKITWRPAMGPDVGCIAGNAGELISSALDGLLASIDEVVNAGSGPQAALAALSAVMGFDLGDCYDKGWQYCIAKGAVPFLAEALTTGGTGKIASSVAKVLDHLPTPNLPGGGHGHTGTPRRTGSSPGVPVCAGHSFGGDTGVVMADGTTKKIRDVEVGDMVLATDPETGETGARQVLATLSHTDQLLTLTTSSGSVVTTEDHRFWNATDREWQESQDLDPGDQLLTADGDIVTVEGLDWTTVHTAAAYDLDIADIDTFYIHTGNDAVLVHNCNFTDIGGGADLIRQTDIDGVAIRVKSGHGYRSSHGSADITSVASRDAVDRAVANDLASRVSSGTTISIAGSGHSTFTTTVAGHTVEYRAVFVPATGRYEIGTYYIP